jgi:phosphoribosylamine--glycine ligase
MTYENIDFTGLSHVFLLGGGENRSLFYCFLPACAAVVLASDGYPEHYDKGFVIDGLDTFKDKEGYYVFHAGTKQTDKGIVTNGGRVLGVTAKGKTLVEARANAYKATEWIQFENKYMRHDIGKAIDEQ